MKLFSDNVKQFEQHAPVRGLSETAVLNTLQELSGLVKPDANSYLSASARVQLAEQIAAYLADPRSTDQGAHDTCGATAAEVVLTTKYPARVVNLLRQVADRGQYVTSLGLVIKPSAQSLIPDSEAQGFDPYDPDASDGSRSYAGQLIQTVGIDAIYAAEKLPQIYEAKGNNEYVLNLQTGTRTSSFPGLEDPDVHEMIKQISGDDLQIYSKEKQYDSVATLRDVLYRLKETKSFPVVFSVDVLAKGGPFFDQYREDRAGLDDGGHYVTLWDIDSKGNVLLDDQFGREDDFESLRRVPVEKLYKSASTFRAAPERPEPFHIVHHRRSGN